MDAYDELYIYTMGRRDFILQHVVDANIAQNAPARNPPPIGVIFALVGLYLHVEWGFTGIDVQNAHKVMGKTKRSWPDVVWPTERGSLTAATVLAMPAGQTRDAGIDDWCKDVWSAFSANHDMVASLVGEYNIAHPHS
ncbi:MAG TPA: DUF5946 family protein [Vicinamibacterales bacterium]|jgi:hypothetical protein|nr:DUF5946 family protein [Vicinamibacterales bacterium]